MLSYARYTLFDQTLLEYLPFFQVRLKSQDFVELFKPVVPDRHFHTFCHFQDKDLGIICASGVGLGLLTDKGPQPWHPAKKETKELCRKAAEYCRTNDVDLAKISVHYFLQLKEPATYLLGMQWKTLVEANLDVCLNGLNETELAALKHLKEK